jgi:hypothetical protein
MGAEKMHTRTHTALTGPDERITVCLLSRVQWHVLGNLVGPSCLRSSDRFGSHVNMQSSGR